VLTIIGIFVALGIARHRALALGLDRTHLYRFTMWTLVGAVLGGHIADTLCYHPDKIGQFVEGIVWWNNPWELLELWDGWRSFGGFFGAIVAALVWRNYQVQPTVWFSMPGFAELEILGLARREQRQPVLALADVCFSVFPMAWAFNRFDSVLIHDHLGTRATRESVFVVFADSVPRYDLGLLDLLVTLLLGVLAAGTWKSNVKTGTYICLFGVLYSPARFVLDFLCRKSGHNVAPLYGTLTPAQWGFAVLFLLSAALFVKILGSSDDRASFA
jgi:prolipoprotein diacylglyceryltransferase